MSSKKILYISQEICPYLPETGLASLFRYLPQTIQEGGCDVRIFMPRYGVINERRNQLHEVIRLSGINIIVDDTDHPLVIKVASVPSTHLQVYFIDNDEFFKRKSMYDPVKAGGPNDNAERSIFFIRGALETIKKLRWIPDIVHCSGWFGALAPLYLKTFYRDDPALANAKVVYTVHPNETVGEMPDNLMAKVAFDKITVEDLAPLNGEVSLRALRRLAMHYADGITIASPKMNDELNADLEPYTSKKILHCASFLDDKAQAYKDFYASLDA